MNTTSTQTTTAIPRRRVAIDSGRWASIRPIERSDAPALSDFYASLSSDSFRRRFLGSSRIAITDLIHRFVDREDEGLVATLVERGPNDGAIVGHATVQADGRGCAEIAFAVADEVQGRGIGRALVGDAVALARRRGVCEITASLLADNATMRQLLRGAGCHVRSDTIDAGVEEISLALYPT